jgi:hypothetical protein
LRHRFFSRKPHAIVSATTTTNPWAEVLDGTGHIYVAEPGCALFPKCASTFTGVIARYNTTNPTSGAVDYAEPSSGVSPALSSPGYLAIDTSGNIWFTESTTGDIGELTH